MVEDVSSISGGVLVREKRRPFLAEILIRLVKEKPLGVVGGIIILAFLISGIFADQIAPYGYNESVLADRLQGPGLGHVLGTDNLGRDLLSRIIYGARISMFVGLGASAIATVLATIIGGVSGFFGGKVDIVIQRFVDAIMCLPSIVIMLTVVAAIGPGLIQVIVVLGVVNGVQGRTRIVRSAVMGVRENVYIEASRVVGASNIRIFMRHILPNVMAPIIIIFTLMVGQAILTEATLSFLGFGIPPPYPTWGRMLSESGRRYMLLAPHMAIWPGAALAIVVYGINMLGDALRDIFDPRLRGGLGRYGRVKRKTKRM